MNQDGASNGLTAPNGPSQQRVILAALANAGLSASDVDVVEGHGTGTTLGDPIEAQALLATYGQGRPVDGPLWLGSVKSNIGHTQAAAGVAGVIKMVLAMRHGVLPATLHVDAPTPQVDWSAGAVSLLTQRRPWEGNGRPRRAGVSSFGISGTNAHVIVEEAPPAPEWTSSVGASRCSCGCVAWVVSGRDEAGLRAGPELRDFVASRAGPGGGSVWGRSLAGWSGVLPSCGGGGDDRDDLMAGLRGVWRGWGARGRGAGCGGGRGAGRLRVGVRGPGVAVGGDGGGPAGLRAGVRGAVGRVRRGVGAVRGAGRFGLDVLRGVAGAPDLARVDVVQPVLWAVMVGLAALWESVGVRPAAVVGHSQGEIAAAVLAGGLSVADAARWWRSAAGSWRRVVRGRGDGVGGAARGRGGAAGGWLGPGLGVAAVNGPTVHGGVGSGRRGWRRCSRGASEDGVRASRVAVDYASHSRGRWRRSGRSSGAASSEDRGRSGRRCAFYSTMTGGLLDTRELDAGYWYRNLRQPVAFAAATQALLAQGYGTFVEVSPHPVLTGSIQDSIDAHGGPPGAYTVGSLVRDRAGWAQLLTSMAEAFVHGTEVNWRALFPTVGAAAVQLPTYPFQRRRFWLSAPAGSGNVKAAGLGAVDHPLLGATIGLAEGDTRVLTGQLSRNTHQWLADHMLAGTALLPGTAFVELALHAGAQVGCAQVDELTLHTPLVLPQDGSVDVQVLAARRRRGRPPRHRHPFPSILFCGRAWRGRLASPCQRHAGPGRRAGGMALRRGMAARRRAARRCHRCLPGAGAPGV